MPPVFYVKQPCKQSVFRFQLSDAISIIGREDFPEKWPDLLKEMVSKFSSGDFNVINGVLRTAHSIFKRYGLSAPAKKTI